MGFWPGVDNPVSYDRPVILFPLSWHGTFWMEDVEPRSNTSIPQLCLDTGILFPKVAVSGIIGHNCIAYSHSLLAACSVSLLAQSFAPLHSLFHLGVFCSGSQCVYLVSQLRESRG